MIGTCTVQGDSGGPYVCKDQQDVWTLVGVVSYGYQTQQQKCTNSVVARVSNYLDWIERTIASNP